MKFLLFIYILISSVSHASDVRLISLVKNKQIKLENIVIKDMPLSIETINKMREKIKSGGGDDVGNGGDDLRREFLRQGEEIIEELRLYEFKNVLDVNRIIVVNDLSVRVKGTSSKVHWTVADQYIFLDENSWNTTSGLLSKMIDGRYYILNIIASANQNEINELTLLKSWNQLSKRNAKVWCSDVDSAVRYEFRTQEFSATGATQKDADIDALNQCLEAGLSDCRIKESIISGFAAWTKHRSKSVGQSIIIKKLSKFEQKQVKCHSIRFCETLNEWAPSGQVRASQFAELEIEANKYCH